MNIDCDIIRDLLPSYVDKLTSDASNRAVEQHVQICPVCKKILVDMQNASDSTDAQIREIDYLKKHKRTARKKTVTTVVAMMAIFAIVLIEILVHLTPLGGATKSDLKDYSFYPVMEVSAEQLRETAVVRDHEVLYRIDWAGGNILQKAVVEIVRDVNSGENQLVTEQINVNSTGVFFKQAGSSVNVVDGVIYVKVTGYRKTLFYTGRAEEFGFAIKIVE